MTDKQKKIEALANMPDGDGKPKPTDPTEPVNPPTGPKG